MRENQAFRFLRPYLTSYEGSRDYIPLPVYKLWIFGAPPAFLLALSVALHTFGNSSAVAIGFAVVFLVCIIAFVCFNFYPRRLQAIFTQSKFTFFEVDGTEREIPIENLLRAKRIATSKFELLDRDGLPFQLNLRVLWFTPKGYFQVLREILHEAANQNPESVPQDWKLRISIPIEPLQHTTYKHVIPASVIVIRTIEIALVLLLQLVLIYDLYSTRQLKAVHLFGTVYVLVYYLPVLRMYGPLIRSRAVEFRIAESNILLDVDGESFEMPLSNVFAIPTFNPHSRIFSKHPIPFQVGWRIAVPDSKKTVFIDPRFLVASNQYPKQISSQTFVPSKL